MPTRAVPPALRAPLHALIPAVLLAVLLAACGASTSPPGAGNPAVASAAPDATGGGTEGGEGAAPSSHASPTDPDVIDHATGPTDVVLRVTETGGFVMMEHAMARVPLFTLYGDGHAVVVPDPFAKGAVPDPGMLPEVREVRLTEPEIQGVLRFALTDGGLGLARERYDAMVMDLPTTIIEITAGGATKRVEAGGLVAEPMPGPDAPALEALAALVSRLRAIATTGIYDPGATVAVIAGMEPGQGPARLAWPWTDLAPGDFAPQPDGDPLGFATRLLTESQREAVTGEGAGRPTALALDGPDGKPYLVVLRPAMPEEITGG